ncbi:MAG: hypothetical protein Fur006_23370 [Coleofasciculaceae cyanobacterium]
MDENKSLLASDAKSAMIALFLNQPQRHRVHRERKRRKLKDKRGYRYGFGMTSVSSLDFVKSKIIAVRGFKRPTR